MNDSDIIELFFARNEQALAETDAAYGSYCQSIAMGILGNRSDAEECVNDAYLKAWQSIPPAHPTSLRLYLARIVRNLSLTRYRHDHRLRRNRDLEVSLSELEACIPLREDQAGELKDLLERFLRGEEPMDRRLFVGRYWYGYAPKILAADNGLSVNAVNLRLMRVRTRLQDFLEKEGYHI